MLHSSIGTRGGWLGNPFCCRFLFTFFKRDPAQSFVLPLFYPCWLWLSEQTKIFLLAAGPKYLKIYHRYWNIGLKVSHRQSLCLLVLQFRMSINQNLCTVKTGSTSPSSNSDGRTKQSFSMTKNPIPRAKWAIIVLCHLFKGNSSYMQNLYKKCAEGSEW